MIEVRVRAEVGGTKYDLFTGFADSWDLGYPGYGRDEVVVLSATDGFKTLARFEPAAPSAPAGGSENTGARISRILNTAGWPTNLRDLDTGDRTVQATSIGMNALSEM